MAYGNIAGGAVSAVVQSSPAWVTACGQAAPAVSSGVFLSPVPTIRNIMKDKTVGNLPLLPYSSMCVNAFMWMTYGECSNKFRSEKDHSTFDNFKLINIF
jgi:hypothetical protein